MKIGPLTITMGEQRPSPDELGATGTTCFAGSLAEEEYNVDLRGSKGIAIYDKMYRSDARVKFALSVCELPLRAAKWSIEPASDDQRDVEIAQALEANLFSGMTITWDSFLHHVLMMLRFGFMPFEKVWEVVDGQVRYRKLAPRLPKTLSEWKLDATGGLQGIVQYAWRGDRYDFITIPVEKLLVFTNEKEGSNFEGTSLLRSAYKHWYYKDNFYRIDGIAAERHSVGVPKFKHPTNADETAKKNLEAIGERLYAQEQQYVRLAEGYDMTIEGLTGTIRDILPSIQHHDKKIAEAVLADFIELGGADRGSWALSRDKSSFFLMALGAVATNITDTMNAYALKPWVDYNYAGIKAYPKLAVGNLETRDVAGYAQAVMNLLNAGGLTAGDEVEGAMRDLLHLPPKPEPEPPAAESEPPIRAAEGSYRRPLTLAEQSVQLGEISEKLDGAQADIERAAQGVQQKQIAKLLEAAVRIIEKRQIERLDNLDVPFRAELAAAIDGVLLDLYKFGRAQVKDELARQKKQAELIDVKPIDATDVALIMEFLKARTRAGVNILAVRLKAALIFEALRQIRQGLVDQEALRGVMADLSTREVKNLASYSVTEAFNFGRANEAEKHAQEITRVQYSAILDEDTCRVCDKLDGEEWGYEDERTARYARGNPDCLGGGRCRCLEVYIYGRETPAEK